MLVPTWPMTIKGFFVKIWVRLVLSILMSVIVAGAGLIHWATLEQRKIAVAQAQDFANNVHQMTLAGLTAMMITGHAYERQVFLNQIKEMDQIESLKVIRADAVSRQFGKGLDGENASDPVEVAVLQSGKSAYSVITGSDGEERMRAVMAAVAKESYLGKNCLACHNVPVGTVLGAVTVEISLAKAAQTTRQFGLHAVLAGVAACIPLTLFIWMFISRIVSRPLALMTEGLNQIVDGDIDESVSLPIYRLDEVGVTTQAFNRVMQKAGELIRQQRLSRMVFDNSLEGITVTDASSRIVMVNKAFTETTGYTAEEALGQTPALLKSGRQGADFYARFWKSIQEEDGWHGEIWNRRKDGVIYPQWISVAAVRNRKGQIEHYIAIFADITERKERERLMAHQALHDALTGLPNRRLFRDHLDQALAQTKRHPTRILAVMFLDLDRFKQINDTLGHEAGDTLLKGVANRLVHCVREVDTVARLGGDEFTILLPEISDESGAVVVAEKILKAMLAPISLGSESRIISTSIGISLYPRDGQNADILLQRADAAMYHVKGSGRAGWSFFSEGHLDDPSAREKT